MICNQNLAPKQKPRVKKQKPKFLTLQGLISLFLFSLLGAARLSYSLPPDDKCPSDLSKIINSDFPNPEEYLGKDLSKLNTAKDPLGPVGLNPYQSKLALQLRQSLADLIQRAKILNRQPDPSATESLIRPQILEWIEQASRFFHEIKVAHTKHPGAIEFHDTWQTASDDLIDPSPKLQKTRGPFYNLIQESRSKIPGLRFVLDPWELANTPAPINRINSIQSFYSRNLNTVFLSPNVLGTGARTLTLDDEDPGLAVLDAQIFEWNKARRHFHLATQLTATSLGKSTYLDFSNNQNPTLYANRLLHYPRTLTRLIETGVRTVNPKKIKQIQKALLKKYAEAYEFSAAFEKILGEIKVTLKDFHTGLTEMPQKAELTHLRESPKDFKSPLNAMAIELPSEETEFLESTSDIAPALVLRKRVYTRDSNTGVNEAVVSAEVSSPYSGITFPFLDVALRALFIRLGGIENEVTFNHQAFAGF